MKYCKKCEVSVDSPVLHCPLCYATLVSRDSHPESPSYPDIQQRAARYNILLRLFVFLSLTVSTVCVTVNLLTSTKLWWSLIVVVNICYVWITIGTALRRHAKLGFTIFIQGLSLGGLIVVLDWLLDTQVNWAFNFVLPFLFFSAMLSITIIVIFKRMAIRDFILYFILTALLGFIPLLFLLLGLVTIKWPSLMAALYSALALVSIFIFADTATKIELKKRFHI